MITEKVGCAYMSDLHECSRRLPAVRQTLLGIETEAYSVEEWNDAISYIYKRNFSFSTPK